MTKHIYIALLVLTPMMVQAQSNRPLAARIDSLHNTNQSVHLNYKQMMEHGSPADSHEAILKLLGQPIK